MSKLVKDNQCGVNFTKSCCLVQDLSRKTLLVIDATEDGLYSFKKGLQVHSYAANNSKNEFEIWHKRLGHASTEVVSRLLKDQNTFVSLDNKLDCVVCPLAKQHRLPFPLSNHTTVAIFELIHCDVWGPFHEESRTGCKYFLTIVDDFSKITWTFLMKAKSETVGLVINYFFFTSRWLRHNLLRRLSCSEVTMERNFCAMP